MNSWYLTLVNSRTWRSVLVVLMLGGCLKQVPAQETEAPPRGPDEVMRPVEPTGPGLIIHVEPEDAEVTVNDKPETILVTLKKP